MHMERKSSSVELKQSDGSGRASFLFSAYGVVDHSGDRVLPGFFADMFSKAQQGRFPKFSHDHRFEVGAKLGRVLSLTDTPEGPVAEVEFNLDKPEARAIYSDWRQDPASIEFSFAYTVQDFVPNEHGGRDLKSGTVFEFGPVLVGDNPSTRLISVKERQNMPAQDNETAAELQARLSETSSDNTPNRPRVKGFEVGEVTASSSTSSTFAFAPEGADYAKDFSRYIRRGVWSRELEAKAQGEATAGAGGALVPRDFYNQLVVFLADSAPMLGISRNIDALTNSLDVPKISSHGSAAWTAEGTAYNESDEVFATANIVVYKATRLVKISEELLADDRTAPGVEDFLAREFGRALGALVNTALTVGTGSAQPFGVVPRATQTRVYATGNSTDVATDELFEVMHTLPTAYRQRAVWVTSDTQAKKLELRKDTTNRYLWSASLREGQPPTLLGRPLIVNNDVAVPAANAKSLLFGDFDGFFVAKRPSISIQRLSERYADTGQIGFIANMRIGSDLIDTKSVVVGVNSAT
jgi:HK97 family phage major capsid protein